MRVSRIYTRGASGIMASGGDSTVNGSDTGPEGVASDNGGTLLGPCVPGRPIWGPDGGARNQRRVPYTSLSTTTAGVIAAMRDGELISQRHRDTNGRQANGWILDPASMVNPKGDPTTSIDSFTIRFKYQPVKFVTCDTAHNSTPVSAMTKMSPGGLDDYKSYGFPVWISNSPSLTNGPNTADIDPAQPSAFIPFWVNDSTISSRAVVPGMWNSVTLHLSRTTNTSWTCVAVAVNGMAGGEAGTLTSTKVLEGRPPYVAGQPNLPPLVVLGSPFEFSTTVTRKRSGWTLLYKDIVIGTAGSVADVIRDFNSWEVTEGLEGVTSYDEVTSGRPIRRGQYVRKTLANLDDSNWTLGRHNVGSMSIHGLDKGRAGGYSLETRNLGNYNALNAGYTTAASFLTNGVRSGDNWRVSNFTYRPDLISKKVNVSGLVHDVWCLPLAETAIFPGVFFKTRSGGDKGITGWQCLADRPLHAFVGTARDNGLSGSTVCYSSGVTATTDFVNFETLANGTAAPCIFTVGLEHRHTT